MYTTNNVLMNKEAIKQLAERIVSGKANDIEIQLYNQIINACQKDQDSIEIFNRTKHIINAELKKAIIKKTTTQTKVVKIFWLRWAAAVLVLFTSVWIVLNHYPKSEIIKVVTQKERFKNDVAPGKNGAILILANGKTISLDSANNGVLTTQGSTDVFNKNGKLIYENSNKTTEAVYNTMVTPKGRQYSLVLADGSKVWLNSASSITFPTAFIGNERRVSVTGEAYFEIAHNPQIPFIVSNGNVNITVLGTHFNINSYDDENVVKITLLEGLISVKNESENSKIIPGEQANLLGSGLIKVLKNVNVDEVVAWKNGVFNFDGTSIETLMRQLSRWYDVDIIYNRKENELFHAEIPRNTKLSDVLKALELTGKVRFGIDGKKIIVNP